MNEGVAKQIARWVALGALFLVPLAPLVVADTFFFPFITGKAFYLRIIIELAVAAWVVLALLDKEYRPRISMVGAAVLGFVLWMCVADAFALNATKAFWSNFERMEGWVYLVHLLGFFFAASAVLRVEKKWRAWFLWSLVVAGILSLHALLQLSDFAAVHQGSTRIDASLGNSAYLAIYLLFSTFVAGWLALTEKRTWLKWSLITLAVLEGVLIFFTETRGAILGLVCALLLAAFLTVLTAGKRARQWAVGALVLLLVSIGSVYLARNSAFVQENRILQRVSSISLSDGQTRFTIWRMAFQGALERPLTGWGQEGFNYIFNKYYDPSLYRQEQWFDRAHNAFIDWLTAGGVPAFLLYLSLFGSAFVLLWRSPELSRPERIALSAALLGYAIHNTFVFDNLYSYVYFFAILALIDSQVARPRAWMEKAPELTAQVGATYALPVAAVALGILVWSVNVPGIRVANGLISALSSQMPVDIFEIGATNFLSNEPEAHLTLAAAYYATGRPSDAVAQLQAAAKLAPAGAAADALKERIDTLTREVTLVGTGSGVPEHIEYFQEAVRSMKKKYGDLRTNAVGQLNMAERALALTPRDAEALAQVSNLKQGISILNKLAGGASDALLWEVGDDRPKGLLRNLAVFTDLVAHPAFAAQEIREQLVSFAVKVVQSPSIANEEKQQVVSLAISEMQKQVTAYPLDARERLQLAYIYSAIGDAKSALNETLAAADLSPRKEQIWIEAGMTAWNMGAMEAAQEYLNKAYVLGPQFQELAAYVATGYIGSGEQEKADKILLDAYGTTTVNNDALSVAYYRTKDWPRLIALFRLRTILPTADARAWFSLAASYYQSGDKANAIKAINTAVQLYPEVAASAATAIAEIQGKAAGQ